MLKNTLRILIAGMLLLPIYEAHAGDARGYIAPPDGTTKLLFYSYSRNAYEKYTDGHFAGNVDFSRNLRIVRPMTYKEIGGVMTSIQALLPFGDVSNGTIRSSGLADPTLILMAIPVANKEKQLWFGLGQYITAPLGNYDKGRALNMGANRYTFKTEAALTKGFGDFYIDLVPSIEFLTDNEYRLNGDFRRLKTDRIFRFETHLSYDFTKTFWLSFDYFYENGGVNKASLNYGPVTKSDYKNNHAVQLTAAIAFAPQQQILFQYMKDVSIRNGNKADQFGIRYAYTL